MAKDAALRAKAKKHYVQDVLPLSAIAKRLSLSVRTLAKWKADDARDGLSWDKERLAMRVSKKSVEATAQECMAIFLEYHRQVIEEVKANDALSTMEKVAAATALADSFNKNVRACASAAPSVNKLAIAIDFLQLLVTFVSEKHPDAAPTLLAVLEPFGAELAKTYG
jgi:uncharacterized protein YjcR